MRRVKKHDDHANHEAWAIPYGDLITLLLAFFVVMYSMSSVNEGKYRILSDSLIAAFRGAPKTLAPINVGKDMTGKGGDQATQGVTPSVLMKLPDPLPMPQGEPRRTNAPAAPIMLPLALQAPKGGDDANAASLQRMADDVQKALQGLIEKKLVVVRRERHWVEVEIRTDILFASGSSAIAPSAMPVLARLADILRPFPNMVRVEGHTDNRPINTDAFPSNWELSAARAASVVHLFTSAGLDPQRLEIIGLGEYRPIADNSTAEGRNINRRVRIVILGTSGTPDAAVAAQPQSQEPAVDVASVPADENLQARESLVSGVTP